MQNPRRWPGLRRVIAGLHERVITGLRERMMTDLREQVMNGLLERVIPQVTDCGMYGLFPQQAQQKEICFFPALYPAQT